MQSEPCLESPKPPQTVRQRVFWFFVGAGLNYVLIATPFRILKAAHPEWSHLAISACSVGVSTTFFFLWNYFVNFRTDSRKRDALARYVTAVIVLWAMATVLLTMFKSFKTFDGVDFPLDLDVLATQLCFGWLKFIVYHKWAFPVAKRSSTPPESHPVEGGPKFR